jgi:hypothetical protein
LNLLGKQLTDMFSDSATYDYVWSFAAMAIPNFPKDMTVEKALDYEEPVKPGAFWEYSQRMLYINKNAKDANPEAAANVMRDRLSREIEQLEARATLLEPLETANRADAAWRFATDVSRDGQTHFRHESTHHRRFHKALHSLITLRSKKVLDEEPAADESLEDEADFIEEVVQSDVSETPEAEPAIVQNEPEPAPVEQPEILQNEPEPAPVAVAEESQKSLYNNRFGMAAANPDGSDANPEMVFVHQFGGWYPVGHFDPAALHEIDEKRRNAGVDAYWDPPEVKEKMRIARETYTLYKDLP